MEAVPQITYTVFDGTSNVTSTLDITVTSVNDAPINTVPSAQTTDEDTAIAIAGISTTDADKNINNTVISVDNGILNVTASGSAIVSNNGTGSVTISGSEADINATLATINYTPNNQFNGVDTLTILTTDTGAPILTDSDTVTINVTSINDAPINTVPLSLTTSEETALPISSISATDADDDLASTELTVSNGTLSAIPVGGAVITSSGTGNLKISGTEADINATLLSLNYNPNTNFVGTDNLTVVSTDSAGTPLSDTDIIPINVTNVNDVPENTVPGTQTIIEDTATVITGISATDVDGNLTQTVISVNEGIINVTGTASAISGNGTDTITITGTEAEINTILATLGYTPNQDFIGSDTLSIISTDADNETSTTDIVALTVTNENDAPINTVPGTQTITEDIKTAITGISTTDVDGNLAQTVVSANNGIINVTGTASAISGNGTNTVTITGTEAEINAILATLEYTSDLNFSGQDTLTIVSTDNDGTPLSDSDDILIDITNVNDAPVADNESVITDEDTPITVDVLDGDTDPDNDTLTITEINGTAISEGQTVNVVGGAVTLTNGELVVLPNLNNTNDVTFNYTVSDGTLEDTGSVNVEITAFNDGPIADDDTASTNEDETVTVDVLDGDSDPEGDTYNNHSC